MTFGETIRARRHARGLSLQAAAAGIFKPAGGAISAQYLHDIEAGHRGPPANAMLAQLAELLYVSPDYLHFLAGRMPDDLLHTGAAECQILAALSALRVRLNDGDRPAAASHNGPRCMHCEQPPYGVDVHGRLYCREHLPPDKVLLRV
ncbi:MAG: hypothetical protein JWP44_4511 [Mucilaginibacter sp.]|nr:hypothetical protein [Mucilaginibacter sp.]